MSVIFILVPIIVIVVALTLYFIFSKNTDKVVVVNLEQESTRPVTCPSQYDWRILEGKHSCNELFKGSTFKNANPDKCKNDSDILPAGEWACIPTTKI